MFPDSAPFPSWKDIIFPAQLTARERVLASDSTAVTIAGGGAGYVAGDSITLSGGTGSSSIALLVGGVSAGSVTAATAYYGTGAYTVLPTNPVAQNTTSGGGSGATFNLSFDPKYHYSWREMAFNPNGDFYIAVSGRQGDAFFSFAEEMNNVAVNVPAGSATVALSGQPYVWMRLRCTKGGALVYDFNAPGLGSESVQINSQDSTTLTLLPVMNYIAGSNITLTLADDTATGKTDLTITGGATSIGSGTIGSSTPGHCSPFGTFAFYGNSASPSLSRLWVSLGADSTGTTCKFVAFCPCDSITLVSGGGGTVPDCCACPASPARWTFTLAGVTSPGGEGCGTGSCTDFNTTWTLTWASGCTWVSNGSIGSCTGAIWNLQCFGGVLWELFVTSVVTGVTATYTLAAGSWNCLGANTLNKTASSGCNTFPSTITVTPA